VKILVLNSGSSSVKFQLFDMADNRVIASGLVEKIGEASSYAKLKDVSADKIYEMRRGGKVLLRVKTLRHKPSYLATNPFVHRKVSRQARLMRTHSTVSAAWRVPR